MADGVFDLDTTIDYYYISNKPIIKTAERTQQVPTDGLAAMIFEEYAKWRRKMTFGPSPGRKKLPYC